MKYRVVGNTVSKKILVQMIKVKQISKHAWTESEGSRRLRLPDFKTVGT